MFECFCEWFKVVVFVSVGDVEFELIVEDFGYDEEMLMKYLMNLWC